MMPLGNVNGMNNQIFMNMNGNQGMGTNITEQEIQNHKNKLNNLIFRLNNTHNLDEETIINNEIKNESECLSSLLNIKRNELFNQQNILNNNFNNNIQIPNMMNDNEEWLKGFQMQVNANNDEEELNPGPKISVIFKTILGNINPIIVNYGTTINDTLEKYLKRVGRPDLIGTHELCFLFNARQLKFGDKTNVESFFKFVQNPQVLVNDINCPIRIQSKDITFKTTNGIIHKFKINLNMKIKELLKYYLKVVKKSELINNNNDNQICFLYNAERIKLDDEILLDAFFNKDENPIIIVNEPNDLINNNN